MGWIFGIGILVAIYFAVSYPQARIDLYGQSPDRAVFYMAPQDCQTELSVQWHLRGVTQAKCVTRPRYEVWGLWVRDVVASWNADWTAAETMSRAGGGQKAKAESK